MRGGAEIDREREGGVCGVCVWGSLGGEREIVEGEGKRR